MMNAEEEVSVFAGEWKDKRNRRPSLQLAKQHRVYFDSIARELRIKSPHDWYKIAKVDVLHKGAFGIVRRYYGGSLMRALVEVYADYEWQLWRFESPPRSYWEDPLKHRQYFDWFAQEFKIEAPTDWFRVTTTEVETSGGGGLLFQFQQSLTRALLSTYPEYDWQVWRFSELPHDLWNEMYQKNYFDWLAKSLNVQNQEDWYSITDEMLEEKGAAKMLQRFYGGSLIKALHTIYPDFCKDIKIQRKYFDLLAKVLKLEKKDDWYKVKLRDCAEKGATSVLSNYYGGYLSKALLTIYPEHKWEAWRLGGSVPLEYWDDRKHHRAFFDWISSEVLSFRRPEDWYQFRNLFEINERGGSLLLEQCYNGSLIAALQAVYPEYEWNLWLFGKAPYGFWKSTKNCRTYLNWLADKLNISHPEEWYSVTYDQLRSCKGQALAKKYKGFIPALASCFPEKQWKRPGIQLHGGQYGKGQNYLLKAVKGLFEHLDVQFNYRHPDLKFVKHSSMELDIFVPSLSLALEYQGYQYACSAETIQGSNITNGTSCMVRQKIKSQETLKRERRANLLAFRWWRYRFGGTTMCKHLLQ